MSHHQLLLVLLSSLLSTVHCWPSGYTVDMCITLTPDDDNNAEGTPSPYSITVTGAQYQQGGEVEVVITGTQEVEGFILQARKADGSTTPVGTWGSRPGQTKTIQCQAAGDTKTHSSTGSKGKSPKFTWEAPPDCSEGAIKFFATVASDRHSYWTGIESNELSCTTAGTTSTTTTTTTAAPTLSTTTEGDGGGGDEQSTTTPAEGESAATEAEEQQSTTTEASNNNSTTTTEATNSSDNGGETTAFCTTLLLACYGLIALSGV